MVNFIEALAKEHENAAARAEAMAQLPGIEGLTGAQALLAYAETSRETAKMMREA